MKTAIITGFRPFGDYVVNPTEKLVQQLENKVLQEHHIKSLVFPTQIANLDTGRQSVRIAKMYRAKVIISLGIASAVQGIRIERFCQNWVENEKYCLPFENKKPINQAWPEKEILMANLRAWNLEQIQGELQEAAIPCEKELSMDAGSFCCNALMYRTLKWMKILNYQIPFMFCHVPCTAEAVARMTEEERKNKILISDEQLLKTIKILLGSYESGR